MSGNAYCLPVSLCFVIACELHVADIQRLNGIDSYIFARRMTSTKAIILLALDETIAAVVPYEGSLIYGKRQLQVL